jgi:N-acetylneuraminate synthase
MEIKLNDGRVLGLDAPPYIVAELNTSHFGNVETAKEMIDAAKESGCDCVKFQSWTADTLYSQTFYEQNPIAKRFVKRYSLSNDQLRELSTYCRAQGIGFSSTPYSLPEAEFLVRECAPPFLKIASMELNNLRFLRALAGLGTAIVLSTGMGEEEEIVRAVEVLQAAGAKNLCVLHCVSIYPAPAETINLRNMLSMQDRLSDVVIGYSDHTIGAEVAVASVALGARLIEKHFTLDNQKIGMDNQMATEPAEMKRLVQQCKSAHAAMGNCARVVSDEERAQRANMRRSVVSARALSAGTVLTEDDVTLKRPGTGIPADQLDAVIGRMISADIEADQVIPPDSLT